MPAIDKSAYVVEGTDTDDLRKGPGHYPDTPLPGERGTVAIAGHRTTHGAPFRNIDKLERGRPDRARDALRDASSTGSSAPRSWSRPRSG